MDEDRSVRIEVEQLAGANDTPRPTDPSNKRNTAGLMLGGLGILLLVAMLVALRPAEGQAADGTQRGTTTTTAAPGAVANNVEFDGEVEITQTVGLRNVISIVNADDGFLALRWGNGPEDQPNFVRSDDGVEWTAVDATFEHGADLPTTILDVSELVTTDDGFALVVTTTEESTLAEPPQLNVERFVSSAGELWVPDPSFDRLALSTDASPIAHTSNAFLSSSGIADGLVGLEAVLRDELSEGIGFDRVCWAQNVGDDYAVLFGCETGQIAELTPDHLLQPERFEAISACLGELTPLNSGPVRELSLTVRNTDTVTLTGTGHLSFLPVLLDDQTIVGFDAGTAAIAEGACAELGDTTELRERALLRWEPGANEPERIPIPPDVLTNYDAVLPRLEPLSDPGEFLAIDDDGIWVVDIETGTWDRWLGGEITEPGAIVLNAGRNRIVELTEGTIDVGRISPEEFARFEVTPEIANAELLFASRGILFVDDKEGRIYKVDLFG